MTCTWLSRPTGSGPSRCPRCRRASRAASKSSTPGRRRVASVRRRRTGLSRFPTSTATSTSSTRRRTASSAHWTESSKRASTSRPRRSATRSDQLAAAESRYSFEKDQGDTPQDRLDKLLQYIAATHEFHRGQFPGRAAAVRHPAACGRRVLCRSRSRGQPNIPGPGGPPVAPMGPGGPSPLAPAPQSLPVAA